MDKEIKDFLDWYKKKEDDDAYIEVKDAYERAWSCRDFELSHLWQRSIFLAAFLIAIAGAYGTLLTNMYFSGEQSNVYVCSESSSCCDKTAVVEKVKCEAEAITYQQNAIAAGLCWLGIAFSILWVMMAKGSKYWFERYEMTICDFENDEVCGDKLKDFPHHGKLATLNHGKYDENIFSTKAGHYSVSKVNCAIGIISLIAFSFLSMLHFGDCLRVRFGLQNLQCAVFAVAHWLFCGAILLVILCFLCKSSHKDEDEKNER